MCCDTTKKENLKNLLDEASSTLSEQVISHSLKRKYENEGLKPGEQAELSTGGSKLMVNMSWSKILIKFF